MGKLFPGSMKRLAAGGNISQNSNVSGINSQWPGSNRAGGRGVPCPASLQSLWKGDKMKYVATFLVMLSISMFSIGCKPKSPATPTPAKSPDVKSPADVTPKTPEEPKTPAE